MKRVICIALALLMVVGLGTNALARVEAGEQRVVLGADLNAEQRSQMFADFGLIEGTVPVLTVTIEEERAHLQDFVPASVIGSRSISSIYIIIASPGMGLEITTNNIDWLTADIYRNALLTAGITDARVTITAPFPVSGTAALTGIYKAFEDITGEALSEEAKRVGIEEAIVTGTIAEALGDDENITALMNELKLILDEIRYMTDDEVRMEIRSLAVQYNIELTDSQVEQILRLARSLQGLDLDALRGTLEALVGNIDRIQGITQGVSGFFQSVGNFFSGVGEAVTGFFSWVGGLFSRN